MIFEGLVKSLVLPAGFDPPTELVHDDQRGEPDPANRSEHLEHVRPPCHHAITVRQSERT